MHRLLQVLALLLSLGLLTFLACRAQQSAPPKPNAPAAAEPDAGEPVDAAPPPEVYFPASKSGGAFLQHQQAPQ